MKGRRIIAYIIDAILIGVASGILCALAGITPLTLSGNGVDILYTPGTWVSLGIAVLYFCTDVWIGGSIGKKLLGMHVIPLTADKDKGGVAVIRAFVKVISIHLIFGIIIFFLGESDSSFHDRIAGTKVVQGVAEKGMPA